MKDFIRISEIFGPTIQGEGALIGRPTVFVRTGGCDYRCSWCDTLYAVLPEYRADWKPMSAEEIMARVEELSGGVPMLVTLSGGNPALHSLEPLINLGHERGYCFTLETQGSIAKPWFADLDYLVLSPKPPSSGMATDWDILRECAAFSSKTNVSLKIVVFDEADYLYARRVSEEVPKIPLYLQVGNHTPTQSVEAAVDEAGLTARLEWLLARALADRWTDVTILPQLHVLLWGNKRGV
jgi:7-carboxy-7-deazaguanine synthase